MAAKTFFITAGEVSGDKLAAAIIQSIKFRDPDARFVGVTGPEMVAAGCESFASIDELSVMGLIEIIKKIFFFIKLKKRIIEYILTKKIDSYIGVDFTEFNLSVEKALRKHQIETIHVKSPSVWAWRRGRLNKIRKAVSNMLLLFPFEKSLYEEANIPATYIGHPMADQITASQDDQVASRDKLGLSQDKTIIAILPGSRRSEISSLLPDFLEACVLLKQDNRNIQFVIPVAMEKYRSLIESYLDKYPELSVMLVDKQARTVMQASDLVLLASGTAALEAMLLKRKMVVCYRLSSITYKIANRMMYISRYALPNILAGRAIVPELIQDEVTPEKIFLAIKKELNRKEQDWLPTFNEIHQSLKCNAAEKAAQAVLSL